MDFFQLRADYDLQLMKPDQTLFDVTANGLLLLKEIIEQCQPDAVLVQGDTTTAFVGALAAFYKKIKIVHIEAGLRSFDKFSPFPEEANRQMVSTLADYHFAPTEKAVVNLEKENVCKNVFNVGNTVIDALLWASEKVNGNEVYGNKFHFLDLQKKIINLFEELRRSKVMA